MKKYSLFIDPRILELLGPNLYTNIYYVLAELIANAYDADAKNVYIISGKDNIRVEDDGHGMSYDDGEIEKYLKVAAVSRTNEDESYSKSGKRRKMGRKGVGKLAALSVSENVDIMTISKGDKSGFVLSRHPREDRTLEPIRPDDIKFEYIKSHGCAIIMRNPQYRLNKSLMSVKNNILKVFPLINSDFKVHIIRDDDSLTIDSFNDNIMSELCAIITLGKTFSKLSKRVPDFPTRKFRPARRITAIIFQITQTA